VGCLKLRQKTLKRRTKIVRWTSSLRATSEYQEKALEVPHPSQHYNNVSYHIDDVMPDRAKGETYIQEMT